MIKELFLVASGGAVGASLRYVVGMIVQGWLNSSFPWGTLFVNITGSFLMGLMAEYVIRRLAIGSELQLLLMTGLLGGYTTFSAFSLETFLMIERNALPETAGYIIASVAGSVFALVLGLIFARNIF